MVMRVVSAVQRGLALGLLALGPATALAQTGGLTTVDTPALGRLELDNGYPTAATASRLYDLSLIHI